MGEKLLEKTQRKEGGGTKTQRYKREGTGGRIAEGRYTVNSWSTSVADKGGAFWLLTATKREKGPIGALIGGGSKKTIKGKLASNYGGGETEQD